MNFFQFQDIGRFWSNMKFVNPHNIRYNNYEYSINEYHVSETKLSYHKSYLLSKNYRVHVSCCMFTENLQVSLETLSCHAKFKYIYICVCVSLWKRYHLEVIFLFFFFFKHYVNYLFLPVHDTLYGYYFIFLTHRKKDDV